MTKKSKRMRQIAERYDVARVYTLEEAVANLKECPPVKFNQTVDFSIKLGVDVKKSDQQVRGTVSLPHGTGKSLRVLVLASGEKIQEALDAGADYAGSEEYFEKIRNGWTDFDAVVATPDLMREVGKLGKILGPRGLMPTPKAGTVTIEVSKAVKEIKGGKIEFKLDRQAVCNVGVGNLSFQTGALVENIRALIHAIVRARPASAKGLYVQACTVSSTMGPGFKIDLREFATTK